ncbi:hydroxysqualene dehydroxylase HpnE [Neisseria zalophi]|uniref:Oxidoreductase n=1 Tax=Neisseria zalophi TaxID=640030 RepID=A0A5J6PZH0_9NEIS|nr:hydroxysqualene dehydroxylase HpnE [Neisseria zalophi]QEY26252.1 oxidoreductase [Neisseria zalophi]
MKPSPRPLPKVAVIGAGWAGLSAAVALAPHTRLTLFEAGRQAGGRARTLNTDSHGFSFLDNGQHILIGAYRSVAAMLNKIGVSEQEAFLRLPLQWHISDGLQFQTAALPPPLHILYGLLTANNIGWKEKIRLINDMRALQSRHHSHPADTTVAAWLHSRRVSNTLTAQFWQPLVWGALNTPLETASLNTLCNVLQDGVWSDAAGSDYLLPKRDLGSLVADPALAFLAQHHADIRMETRVGRLSTLPGGKVCINNETFDAAILAVAPYHAAALMPSETTDNIQTAYRNMRYHAITTVYLRYAESVHLPAPLTGLAENTAQWFIDRGALGLSEHETAAVISVSDLVGPYKNGEWIKRVHHDLKTLCPHLGEPTAAQVITEKRATAASSVNRYLPDLMYLHQRYIYPCGDYLHPRYPATLEAAVQSGLAAAEQCIHDLNGLKNADRAPS